MFGDNNKDKLSIAISGLTLELGRWREERARELATKRDIERAVQEIIKALGERVDPAKLKQIINMVEAGKLKVQGAVDDNK